MGHEPLQVTGYDIRYLELKYSSKNICVLIPIWWCYWELMENLRATPSWKKLVTGKCPWGGYGNLDSILYVYFLINGCMDLCFTLVISIIPCIDTGSEGTAKCPRIEISGLWAKFHNLSFKLNYLTDIVTPTKLINPGLIVRDHREKGLTTQALENSRSPKLWVFTPYIKPHPFRAKLAQNFITILLKLISSAEQPPVEEKRKTI